MNEAEYLEAILQLKNKETSHKCSICRDLGAYISTCIELCAIQALICDYQDELIQLLTKGKENG